MIISSLFVGDGPVTTALIMTEYAAPDTVVPAETDPTLLSADSEVDNAVAEEKILPAALPSKATTPSV